MRRDASLQHPRSVGTKDTGDTPERVRPTRPAPVTSIDLARRHATKGKASALTEAERQLLLDEIAEISAELCDLQVWAADIARRVTNSPDSRVGRTA